MKLFNKIAIAEGVSFILLLCIAMPLKYIWKEPMAVKYMGWLHGVLFVAYIGMLLKVWAEYKWSFTQVALALLAGIVPFGTFLLSKKLKNTVG